VYWLRLFLLCFAFRARFVVDGGFPDFATLRHPGQFVDENRRATSGTAEVRLRVRSPLEGEGRLFPCIKGKR
jgi:hypothetical protein